MATLKDRLLELIGPTLLAKCREAFSSCKPIRKALPQPRISPTRQLSLGSSLAAFRRDTAEHRLAASRSTLLGACVGTILAHGIARYGPQLRNLPPDLIQALLEALVAAGQLTDSTTRCFRGLVVFELRLASYPGVRNAWLGEFYAGQLSVVDLRGCTAVSGDRLACSLSFR